MNSKYTLNLIAFIGIALFFLSCNSSDSDITVGGQSSDGQINSFKITGTPQNAIDTLTYPALAKALFTIKSKTGDYRIFNTDSLPYLTKIRSLKIDLTFTSTPLKIELLYKAKNSSDSLAEWNTVDSVKFIMEKNSPHYYPRFRVTAPDNTTVREYLVDLRIHKISPDSIEWTMVNQLNIKRTGENKTIMIARNQTPLFFNMVKNGVNTYTYTSSINSPSWTPSDGVMTNLPHNVKIQSLQQSTKLLVVLDEQGNAYTADINSDAATWEKQDATKITSVVGILPQKQGTKANAEENFLVIYANTDNISRFGKTSDFKTVSNIELDGRLDNTVMPNFPVQEFSSSPLTIQKEEYLVTVGGKDKGGQTVGQSWIIKSINVDKISMLPGNPSRVVPFTDGVTGFVYDSKIYALSSDSLSLYHSNIGDVWTKAPKEQKLHSNMKLMNRPSVVVDSENYIWVFGGMSKPANNSYGQNVYRGRINRLIPKN